MSQFFISAAMSFSVVFGVMFLIYVGFLVMSFAKHQPDEPGDSTEYQWHLFLPCLDEAAVIGGTVEYLRTTFPSVHLWVVDDDSEDDTAGIISRIAARDPRVHLVQRRRPRARTGKSDALNNAYQVLNSWLSDHGGAEDRAKVIVGVVDADGRPAANCLDVISGATMFGDAEVGAVQVEVRMINRHDRYPLRSNGVAGPAPKSWADKLSLRRREFFARTLVRVQDIEFRVPIAALQLARRKTNSVGMGGNGQFTRLSGLDAVADDLDRPWHGSLLEDFEIGLHLLLVGFRNQFTKETWVDQEGLFDVRRLLTQRTRWGQGNMMCTKYIRQVWTNKNLSNLGVMEISYYLLQPWLQVLGSILFPVPVIIFGSVWLVDPAMTAEFFNSGGWALVAMYLLLGIGPFILWGLIYRWKCEPTAGWLRSAGWGLAFVGYVYLFYLTSWMAMFRILRRRNGWAKTRRNAEDVNVGPVAVGGRV